MLDGVFFALGRGRTPDQRPPARGIDAVGRRAPPPTSVESRPPLVRWHKERSQSAKTVGRDKTQRYQFRECFLELGPQQTARIDQFVEKRGAVFLNTVDKQLRARARSCGSIARVCRRPHACMASG